MAAIIIIALLAAVVVAIVALAMLGVYAISKAINTIQRGDF